MGDLGEQRRRMQDLLGRMDSDMRLLEEKGKNMVARLSDMRMQLSTMRKQRADAAEEHRGLEGELSDTRVRERELTDSLAELSSASHDAVERRRALDAALSRLTADERSARSEADRETLAYAKLEDQVSNAQVEDQMFATRLEQLDESASTAEEALAERERRADLLEEELERAREASDAIEAEISRRTSELERARSAEREARTALSSARATLDALRAVDADVEKSSPLTAALAEQEGAGVECRLADLIDADASVEGLVEQLLGDDLAALVVADATAARALAERALDLAEAGGAATIVSRAARSAGRQGTQAPGAPLVDRLRVADDARALLEALLGDVRLVDDVSSAVQAHELAPQSTYVTPEGAAMLPDGRLRVGSAPTGEAGALERKRRIRALDEGMDGLEEAFSAAEEDVDRAETELSSARERAVAAKGEVARLSAELSSATSERGRLESQLAGFISERAQVSRRREAAAERAAEARGKIEGHRRAAREARERADALAAELSEKGEAHQEAIAAQGRASRALSDARLQLAMATERRTSLEARVSDLERRVRELGERIDSTERSSRALEVVRLRVDPLHDRYDLVRERALEWAARLKDRASLAEADSDSLKRTIGEAREAVSAAASELERAREDASAVKVDLGKLEVQVEGAINAITATGAVLDEALEIPAPDDREAAERRVEELRRQIDSIGPVNAVAMDEYARLKERSDYINEQVADLEGARASLRKITAAIDRKMRSRFLAVFEQVNENFSEVFSLLFPGGQAHIEMTDPDNPADTGIEIVAQPRGKRIAKMMLMSGGEKSLTALALLFAVYQVRTVPFYVFDEVEAALDDSNLSKLLDAIERLKQSTQLIVISHQRRTMEQADVLYGVSMQADGVSRVVSQRLDRATGKVVDA